MNEQITKECKMRTIRNGGAYCAKSDRRVDDYCNICNQFTVLDFPSKKPAGEKYALRVERCKGKSVRVALSPEIRKVLGSPKCIAVYINKPKTKLMIKSCGEADAYCIRIHGKETERAEVNRSALAKFIVEENKAENPYIIEDYVYDEELKAVVFKLGELSEGVQKT